MLHALFNMAVVLIPITAMGIAILMVDGI